MTKPMAAVLADALRLDDEARAALAAELLAANKRLQPMGAERIMVPPRLKRHVRRWNEGIKALPTTIPRSDFRELYAKYERSRRKQKAAWIVVDSKSRVVPWCRRAGRSTNTDTECTHRPGIKPA